MGYTTLTWESTRNNKMFSSKNLTKQKKICPRNHCLWLRTCSDNAILRVAWKQKTEHIWRWRWCRFWLWEGKGVDKSSFKNNNRRNYETRWNCQKQSFQGSGNRPKGNNKLKSTYSWKTADLWVRTVGVCGFLACGYSHTPPQIGAHQFYQMGLTMKTSSLVAGGGG